LRRRRAARQDSGGRHPSLYQRPAAPHQISRGDLRLCAPLRRRGVLDRRGDPAVVFEARPRRRADAGLTMQSFRFAAASLAASLLAMSAAHAAAPCRTAGPYEAWLAGFEREAAAAGITQ